MMNYALSFFPLKFLPLVAFMIFLAIFACVTYWVMQPRRRDFYEAMGELPLDNEIDFLLKTGNLYLENKLTKSDCTLCCFQNYCLLPKALLNRGPSGHAQF